MLHRSFSTLFISLILPFPSSALGSNQKLGQQNSVSIEFPIPTTESGRVTKHKGAHTFIKRTKTMMSIETTAPKKRSVSTRTCRRITKTGLNPTSTADNLPSTSTLSVSASVITSFSISEISTATISFPTSSSFSCSTPSYSASSTITGTGLLPKPTTFVRKEGNQLFLDSASFKMVGPNIYWLCQDENIAGTPPTKDRVREALAIAVAMGATTIRALSCGISVGSANSLEPSLDEFGSFDSHDYAIYAAGEYGLRIIMTLTDVYDYYHGGQKTFLDWNGVSTENNFNNFYTNERVINSFKNYVSTLLNHQNYYNGLKWSEDPTIVAWETGNELGGYIGKNGYPPAVWTNMIAQTIRQFSTNQLILDGSDGFYNYSTKAVSPSLNVAAIDIMSDHGYPRNVDLLKAQIPLAAKNGKVFFVGEYDWTFSPYGSNLGDYLNELESGNYVGDMIWNIMGHDSTCCNFVTHEDGYSAYYPNGNSLELQNNLLLVVQHWYRLQNLPIPNELIAVTCPQPEF